MKIHGQPHRSIEADHANRIARIVDQTFLPHQVGWRDLQTMEDAAEAIQVMRVAEKRAEAAWNEALSIGEEDVQTNHAIDVTPAALVTGLISWSPRSR